MREPRDSKAPSPDGSDIAALQETVARLGAEVTELRQQLAAAEGRVPARQSPSGVPSAPSAVAGLRSLTSGAASDRRRLGLMIRALLVALGIGVGMLYFIESRRPSAAEIEEATARARANRVQPDGPPGGAPAPPAPSEPGLPPAPGTERRP